MKKSKALGLVNKLISDCDELGDSNINIVLLREFIIKVISIINNVFPNKSKEKIEEFEQISFAILTCITEPTDQEGLEVYQRGLEHAKTMLQLFKKEIENYREDSEGLIIYRQLRKRCFIVHGHNEEMKLKICWFIEKQLNIECIILHEQPNKGRTVLNKFEDYSEVDFAVCIWSADDLGKKKGDEEGRARARQNVVLERFFLG